MEHQGQIADPDMRPGDPFSVEGRGHAAQCRGDAIGGQSQNVSRDSDLLKAKPAKMAADEEQSELS